ncbi:MAG: hypothetical protein HYX63_01430 [Gammaproteobacteria bacterium]|nr:hypothetical protein [Gammaproteobacteria bacterium]
MNIEIELEPKEVEKILTTHCLTSIGLNVPEGAQVRVHMEVYGRTRVVVTSSNKPDDSAS